MVHVDVWTDEPGPVGLFSWQCSPIFTLYTHGLHAAQTKIGATASWSRIFLTADPPTLEPEFRSAYRYLGPDLMVLIDEPADSFGFSDGGWAQIDPTLLDLPRTERASGYLEWLHGIMVRLARFRGWDEEPLQQAHRFCLERGLTATFESPRRQSPDRQHKAILTLNIDPDGIRHLTITVQDRAGSVVASKEGLLRPFLCDFYSWRTLRSRFRWTSASSLATEDAVIAFSMTLPGADRIVDHASMRMPRRGFITGDPRQ